MVKTNMVFFTLDDLLSVTPNTYVQRLREEANIWLSAGYSRRLRAVTHYWIQASDIDLFLQTTRAIMQ